LNFQTINLRKNDILAYEIILITALGMSRKTKEIKDEEKFISRL